MHLKPQELQFQLNFKLPSDCSGERPKIKPANFPEPLNIQALDINPLDCAISTNRKINLVFPISEMEYYSQPALSQRRSQAQGALARRT
jgi:hypothetical protein